MRLAVLIALAPALFAARQDPVQWALTSESAKAAPGSTVTLKLTATLEEGWHLYSPTTPKGTADNPGPNPTTIQLSENPAVGAQKLFEPKPERKFDPNFNLDTETYEKEAVFYI